MKKIILSLIVSLIFLSGVFLLNNAVSAAVSADNNADNNKEYRFGQIIAINDKNYLIAGDKEFAEILEITSDNKLAQVSEIHGVEKIEAMAAGQNLEKYYLVIASGRYLYHYDISDPSAPKIEFRRDLHITKRGQFKIGSIYSLAGNKNILFGGGAKGVRSFFPDNLFVNKIYTHEKSYGLAADDKNLCVITENKGLVYDIATGNKLAEINLENIGKTLRSPYLDGLGNAYFPSDQGLVKLNIYTGEQALYVNQVPKGDTYSYGASSLLDGNVYYANGHGLALLDKNNKKIKFFNTSWQERYGANSWAVGVAAAKIGARDVIINFNKSSILLLDKNLKVLTRHSYKKPYSENIAFDLKITASANRASSGQKISLKLYGFWPNENVSLAFGKNNYTVKVDNQGYGIVDLTVPYQAGQQALIQAVGQDSKFSYQSGFTVL